MPKAEELVAAPYRHGSKEAAETFFLNGMTSALRRLWEQAHPGFPVTIYYAFKQSERTGNAGTVGTGWELRDPLIFSYEQIEQNPPFHIRKVGKVRTLN